MDGRAGTQVLAEDEALQRHAAALDVVSDCPLVAGGRTTLLPSGAQAQAAMFQAIEGAHQNLHLEYYEFENVHRNGHTVTDLLVEKLRQGIHVALSYDAAGWTTPMTRSSPGCARRAQRCWSSRR